MQNQSHYQKTKLSLSILTFVFFSSFLLAAPIYDITNFNYSTHAKTSEVVNQTWYIAQTFDKGKYTILRRSAYLNNHSKSVDGLIKMLNQYGKIIEKTKSDFTYGTLEVNILNKPDFFKNNSSQEIFNYLSALVFTLCEAKDVDRVLLNFPKTDIPALKYSRKDLTNLGIIPLLDETPPKVYKVKKGDTFYDLGKKFNVDYYIIKQNNYVYPNKAILLKNSILFICPSFKKLQLILIPQEYSSTYSLKSYESITLRSSPVTYPTVTTRHASPTPYSRIITPLSSPMPYSTNTVTSEHPDIHFVRKGESLYSISTNYNLTVEDIKRINKISDNNIFPNQKLILKEGSQVYSTLTTKKSLDTGRYYTPDSDDIIPTPTFSVYVDSSYFNPNASLGEVYKTLEKAFPKQYNAPFETKITHQKTGFRFITPLEQINDDASPKKDETTRWNAYIPIGNDNDDISELFKKYLKALITAKKGLYRVFLINVTPNMLSYSKFASIYNFSNNWTPMQKLPEETANLRFKDNYFIEINVYVFERKEYEKEATLILGEERTKKGIPAGPVHLAYIGFYNSLKSALGIQYTSNPSNK